MKPRKDGATIKQLPAPQRGEADHQALPRAPPAPQAKTLKKKKIQKSSDSRCEHHSSHDLGATAPVNLPDVKVIIAGLANMCIQQPILYEFMFFFLCTCVFLFLFFLFVNNSTCFSKTMKRHLSHYATVHALHKHFFFFFYFL